MRRVRCPECDSRVRVPDDHQKSFIRCPSCDKKIRLDEDDEHDEIQRADEPSSSTASHWLALAAFLMTGLGAAVCVGVAYFQPGIGFVLGIALGVFVSLFAYAGSCVLASKQGNHIGFLTYLGVPVPLAVFLLLFSCGLYLFAYACRWVGPIVKSFRQRPKVFAPWLALNVLGLTIFFGLPVMHSVAKNNGWLGAPQVPVDDKIAQVPPGDDPNNKKQNNPPKKVNADPPRQTGDAALDNTLNDLADVKNNKFTVAVKELMAMKPNEHRDVVAERVAALIPDTKVPNRAQLVRILAIWGTSKEVPVLIEVLGDPDIYTRNETLEALGKIKDAKAVVPMLRCQLEIGTQWNAEHSLKVMGSIAEPELLAMMKQKQPEKDAEMKIAAIQTLARIGTEQSIPTLEMFVNERGPMQTPSRQALAAIRARSKKS